MVGPIHGLKDSLLSAALIIGGLALRVLQQSWSSPSSYLAHFHYHQDSISAIFLILTILIRILVDK